jgi:hypothetical protein
MESLKVLFDKVKTNICLAIMFFREVKNCKNNGTEVQGHRRRWTGFETAIT